jgi:cytochrome b561
MSDIKYTKTAIILHWLIALAIILQLSFGLWMVEAIKVDQTRNIAYEVYQYHKSFGIIILILSLIRVIYRFFYKAPDLPSSMNYFEIIASKISHYSLYFLMIAIPLMGWAMVSTSPYGLPTMIFGLFEWPHLSFLNKISNALELNRFFNNSHELLSYSMIILLLIHIAAVVKHHFINKDGLIKRMLP